MALPEDFSKIYGSTATGGLTPISDVNYAKGWEFVGSNPPTKNDFSYLQNLSDLKSQWLYSNKLQRADPFADIKSDGAAAISTALANLGFAGSLTSPGYAVIPLGTKKLVIQWGTVTVPIAGSVSATYLLALDLGLAQFCTPIDVSSVNNYRVGVATSTNTSITLTSTNTQSVTGVMWLSIGAIN